MIQFKNFILFVGMNTVNKQELGPGTVLYVKLLMRHDTSFIKKNFLMPHKEYVYYMVQITKLKGVVSRDYEGVLTILQHRWGA
jgi:hypothetical protein